MTRLHVVFPLCYSTVQNRVPHNSRCEEYELKLIQKLHLE